MKTLLLSITSALALLTVISNAAAQPTTFTLNPLPSFGNRGDGSIQPGDSIGLSPLTGYEVKISGPGTPPVFDDSVAWFPGEATQDVRPGGSTNGFNMRGLTYDPISGNLIFVDTHEGSGGTVGGNGALSPYSAIYILNANSGQIIAALNTNGIVGGAYTHVCVGVADDGVVYVANQVNKSTTAYKIYRWPTANPSNPGFAASPTVAYSNAAPGFERIGLTMAVRGAGTNTQILVGTADPAKVGATGLAGTNVFLFTTGDGTNFVHHRLYVPGLNSGFCNDGIAFGPGNTFWTKEVGSPLYYLAFDPTTNDVASTNACAMIASYPASSPNDPLLNLSALAVDNTTHLMGSLEEIGGIATGGRGKVWLFDISDPTNRAPAVLASRTYIPNLQKTTAPMGYLSFGHGRLYAHASNNGLLVSTVDSIGMPPPSFNTDLPATTRTTVGQSVHFEVFAMPDVTNYQWYSNSVLITGANTYFLNLPSVAANLSGTIYKVVASNAAGSATSVNSTLQVVSTSDFFHLDLLWSKVANSTVLTDTNYITMAAAGTPNERTIAYNALSNQLLVVRGPATLASLRVFVVDPDSGAYLYSLNTTGITASAGAPLTLCGIGVADDGAVYAASVATDNSFKVYRWADTASNTAPQVIFGTNSSAASGNPISDLVGNQYYRFGDTLAVRGAGNSTEIILDSQNSAKLAGILRPLPDGTMTNWTQTGYLLQNIQGSYGSEAYGTTIGRSIQFGNGATFWQKRYNAAVGAPLALMGFNPGGGLSPLVVANTTPELFTNGPVAISSTLNLMVGINFVGGVGSDSTVAPDVLDYFDITDPSQAVLLSRQNLPGANSGKHKANSNAIGQTIFGVNRSGLGTNLNYVFAIDGNNGIAAYVLAGGVTPPPRILAQPKNLRVLQATSGSLGVGVDQLATIAWYKGTNSPVDTGARGGSYNITSAQLSDAGDYFAIVTNVNGAVTSQVAHVSVSLPGDNYTLTQIWGATPGNAGFPYVTSDGGANTPNERAFAYNAVSNQLIVVRCPPGSTAYTLWVVDAGTGSNLYTLNTTGVIHEGGSEVSGSNPIDLVGAAAADDGAIYVCNETPNASGGAFADPSKMLHVYRWANSGPSTTLTVVYEGDPSGASPGINYRWGDAMAARGGGTNTELILDSGDGTYAAVLKPTDASMTTFSNYWFFSSAGGGSIGRSIQFGTNNSVLQKRKAASLVFSTYILTNQTSSAFQSVDSPVSLGGVFVDSARNLAVGVDFVGSGSSPDAVALYDITDPSSPMFIAHYNFPANQVANANVICETIISGSRVYSLDANNGLVAFNIVPPVNSAMLLQIALADATHVKLSWANAAAVLQGTTNLPAVWTDLTAPGLTNSVQLMNDDGIKFYRLIQR